MKWEPRYFCVNCSEHLTNHQRMYSSGVCPKCGYRGANSVTIVACETKAARWIRTGPWWAFWRGRWEYRDVCECGRVEDS